ncbi:MAG: SDR family NAD(P)-dependent oxidoreductase [Roseococcus sp.]|nr:SDR family NAD(P)-dependent oxidoreductase [Roseococcus sp.]
MAGNDVLAVVSGASSGIGLALSEGLLARGARVLAIARGAEGLAAARASLPPEARARFLPLPADVREAAALEAAIATALTEHGPPGWCIACAGIVLPGRFLDLAAEDHAAQWATNYQGAVNLLRACLPTMRRARRGRVVLVSSAAALGSFYGYSGYAPGKAALRALGDILHLELGLSGITVTTAFPPDTDTPQLREERARRPRVAELFLRSNRVFAPQHVARLILEGAERGRRHVTPGLGVALLHRLPWLIQPGLHRAQRRLMERYEPRD